jgi:hypothetical protein
MALNDSDVDRLGNFSGFGGDAGGQGWIGSSAEPEGDRARGRRQTGSGRHLRAE